MPKTGRLRPLNVVPSSDSREEVIEGLSRGGYEMETVDLFDDSALTPQLKQFLREVPCSEHLLATLERVRSKLDFGDKQQWQGWRSCLGVQSNWRRHVTALVLTYEEAPCGIALSTFEPGVQFGERNHRFATLVDVVYVDDPHDLFERFVRILTYEAALRLLDDRRAQDACHLLIPWHGKLQVLFDNAPLESIENIDTARRAMTSMLVMEAKNLARFRSEKKKKPREKKRRKRRK